MSELETVEIVNEAAPSGFTRINASDFDAEKHVVYVEAVTGEAQPFTREGIAAMEDREAVLALLEAHGVKPDRRKGLEALRDELIAVMFVG